MLPKEDLTEEIKKEIKRDSEEYSEASEEERLSGLKPELNNLLHMYLPPDTTIKEAEIISGAFFSIIANPSCYLKR